MQILCKDPRTVAAGGAAELEIAKQLAEFGNGEAGLDQYAIAKYAEALEVGAPSRADMRAFTRNRASSKAYCRADCCPHHRRELWAERDRGGRAAESGARHRTGRGGAGHRDRRS